jgi:cysteine desulfuration protein SufE
MTLVQDMKNRKILEIFEGCSCPKEVYQKIIALGSTLKPFSNALKCDQTRVFGCQSLMYLSCERRDDGCLEFRASSDALISKGLAALMLELYNFEKPQDVIALKPDALQKIRLFESLSPNRINGMKAFYLKILSFAKLHAS